MAAEIGYVASQLEQSGGHHQPTSLYESGVRAFEQGRWDVAVERLGQLVEGNPDDAETAGLLEAAREALEHSRAVAREPIELVRQVGQSTVQSRLGPSALGEPSAADSSASVPGPAPVQAAGPVPQPPSPLATLRLPGLDPAAIAPAAGTPDAPAPTGRRSLIPWLSAGLVIASWPAS